jgi:hypothetical protein
MRPPCQRIAGVPSSTIGFAWTAATDGDRRRLAELAWTLPEAAVAAALAAVENFRE